MRVLLVDDEDEMVTALAERLSLRGIEADWVNSGEDAIARLTDKKYDIVVLDVKMPGMSGLETMEQVQKLQPQTKVIFLTGHGSVSD
ncbi:MAG: response regulator, partial [Desulfobacterales bacterium]|nr:response regulator [Desulfobacterales bacterium]